MTTTDNPPIIKSITKRKHPEPSASKEVVDKKKPTEEISDAEESLVRKKNIGIHEFPNRTSPNALFSLVSVLKDEQRKAIINIGFGSLLELKVSYCPSKLCKYLAENFDYGSGTFFLQNGARLQVDEEDVQLVLNLPRGCRLVIETSDSAETDEMVESWKRRWGGHLPTNSEISRQLAKRSDFGDDFIRDFMVLVMSSFIWGHKNSKCKTKVLPSLMHISEIKEFNWCKYTIMGLAEACKDWKENKTSKIFFGPQTFMMLFYLDRTSFMYKDSGKRVFPIISNWDNDKVSERISLEEKNDSFGNVRVNSRISYVNMDDRAIVIGEENVGDEHQTYNRAGYEVKDLLEGYANVFRTLGDVALKLGELHGLARQLNVDATPFIASGLTTFKGFLESMISTSTTHSSPSHNQVFNDPELIKTVEYLEMKKAVEDMERNVEKVKQNLSSERSPVEPAFLLCSTDNEEPKIL